MSQKAGWSIDLERGELRGAGGEHVELRRRSFELLLYLARNLDRVVSKNELVAQNWHGLAVTDDSLTKCVSDIRHALGSELRDTLRTVSGRGYMLSGWREGPAEGQLLPVMAVSDPPPHAAPPGIPLVAVLPFQNLGGEKTERYFAEGVVDDIIMALGRFRSFGVAARNSSFVYGGRPIDVRQVARELGVSYVLEGSIRRDGGKLRISAQLAGAHLWAQRFEGDADEVFDMQERVCEAIAGTMEPEVIDAEIARSRRSRPGSLEAYDLYLQALPRMEAELPADNADGYRLASRAVELSPDYAPALAMAAWFLEHRYHMGWPPLHDDDMERVAALVERAIINAGEDARIIGICGYMMMSCKKFDRAVALCRRALQLNPNNVDAVRAAAIVQLHIGSVEEAEVLFLKALRLRPSETGRQETLTGMVHVNMYRGDYEEALRWAERSFAVNARFAPTHWMAIAANAHLGRMDEARRLLAAYRVLEPSVTIRSIHYGQPNRFPERTAPTEAGLRLAGLAEQ
ncbi:MAG: adenylate cyclase [Hyphomicrobiales bacterium]|nr:adenylate cyclase [Hyphomicrobiales bacterium]